MMQAEISEAFEGEFTDSVSKGSELWPVSSDHNTTILLKIQSGPTQK